MPRQPPALLVVSGKGRDSWLLSALLNAVLDDAEQDVFVEWAATLDAALERLRARNWQACLLDERVGDDTGLDVLRRARQAGVLVPMVLCMAHEDKTLEDIALEEGAAEVVPLATTSPRELGRRLHSAMVRGRAETKLRASGDRFGRLFEEAPVALTVSTLEEGRFLEANAVFCRTVGYRRDEIVGHTSTELGFFVEERTRTAQRARMQEAGGLDASEMLLQNRQGRVVHMLFSTRIVQVEGKPCILAVGRDITGQRRAEVDLLHRDAQLEAAEARAGSGSWDYDVATSTMTWSANLERLLGLAEAPRTLEGFLRHVEPDDRERVAEAMRKATQRGAPLKVRFSAQGADGRVQEFDMRGLPDFDVQDEAVSISGTIEPAGPRGRRPAAVAPTVARTPEVEGALAQGGAGQKAK